MRILRSRSYEEPHKIIDPMDFDLYFSVFNLHKFYPMSECDFCWICNHSLKTHIEYEFLKQEVINSCG